MRKGIFAWHNMGRERLIWSTTIIGFSFGIVVLFQNCTRPVTGTDSTMAAAAHVDFAYDATVDQIAYMSCSNMATGSYDQSAYFTFRAGAYRSAGVGLNSAFQTTYKLSTKAFKSAMLQESPSNNTTALQLAIRPINSYQNILTQSAGSSTLAQDYDNLFANLGEQPISDWLAGSSSGSRVRYLRDGSPTGAHMEGSVRFNTSYGMMNAMRTATTNGDYLALTYSNNNTAGSGQTLARSPADISLYATNKIDANKVVYGRGFSMSYGQPSVSGLYGNFPQQVMRSVTEYNLQNLSDRTITSTWTCPTTMQFRIVRITDLAAPGAYCAVVPDPPVLSDDLAKIRESLKVEDWYVDMTHHCIIPKKSGSGCYGDSTTVNYNLSTACDPNNTGKLCTSFASICYRD